MCSNLFFWIPSGLGVSQKFNLDFLTKAKLLVLYFIGITKETLAWVFPCTSVMKLYCRTVDAPYAINSINQSNSIPIKQMRKLKSIRNETNLDTSRNSSGWMSTLNKICTKLFALFVQVQIESANNSITPLCLPEMKFTSAHNFKFRET